MSTDSLTRRIDRALWRLERQQQRVKPSLSLSLHLLTDDEQGRLETYLERLQATYGGEPLSRETLRLVTDEELEQLEQWALLLKALEQEDLGAASSYRAALAAMPAA